LSLLILVLILYNLLAHSPHLIAVCIHFLLQMKTFKSRIQLRGFILRWRLFWAIGA